MATLILRPVSDKSLKHTCSSGSKGYALVKEASSDGDSTYIYQSVSNTSSASVTSSFTLGGTLPSGSFKITGATLYVVGKSTSKSSSGSESSSDQYSGTYQLSIDSSASSMALSTSYQTSSASVATGLINNTYTNSNFPSLSVTIVTTGNLASSAKDNFQIRITQIYLELEYEEVGYYAKINGSWQKIITIYKKIDGVWTEFNYSYTDDKMLIYKGHLPSD